MNIDIHEAGLKLYQELFNLGEEFYNIKDQQKSLVQSCVNFQENWNVLVGAENIQFKFKADLINEFESIKSKLLRNTKKCFIIGRTSSGKSTLINALLTENILPTNFGSTSNCFVEIVASPTGENYLSVNNQVKKLEELKDINNLASSKHLENGSRIIVYYDKNNCQLLKDKVVIIDTPGNDTDLLNVDSMEEYLKDADIIVLVVNAMNGLSSTDRMLFEVFKTRYAKLNVIVVYNFWDVVNQHGEGDLLKEQYITNAKSFLCNIFNISHTEAVSSIFFVSSLERISFFTNDFAEKSGVLWNERNESFAHFFSYLESKMSESLFTKNYNYLMHLKSMVTSNLNQCQNCIFQMKNKRIELAGKLKNELKCLEGLNENINKEISQIFNEAFEDLLIKGLEELKVEIKVEKNSEYENFSYSIDENEIINQKLAKLLEETIKENLEKLKKNIKEFLKHEDETIFSFRQNIFNEIYFPLYFNLNNELNSFDIQAFKDNLMKISRVTKIGSGVTVGLTGVAVAAGVATGGAAFAVIGLAEAAIVAASVAAGGAVAGGAIGAGTAFGSIKAFKLPFRFVWKNNEIAIKALWNSFELALMNSYSEFIERMISNVTELITPIEEKAVKMQNNLNNIAEELRNFQNYLLIN